MPRIFISHSSKDNDAAESLKSWLEVNGFDQLFLDFDRHHGIPPGDEWERKLYTEIQSSTAVILLLTRNWFESKWCFAEFTQARAHGKSVLPVLVAPDGDQFIGDNLQKIALTPDRDDGLARLLDRLKDIALDGPEGFAHPKGRPPYPGMMSFEEEDAAIFFGRGPEVRDTLERLERLRRTGSAKVLQLHGESGSGKSSLLKAGVLPQLKRRGSEWIVLPHFRPGPRPLRELRNALRAAFAQPGNPLAAEASDLIDAFIADPFPAGGERLIDLLHDQHPHDGRHRATVLLAIDQFEEAATLAPPDESDRFIRALGALLAPDLRTAAIITLRTADLPQMSTLLDLPSDQRLIGPFPLDRLPEIVRKPAATVGLQIDDSLVAAIARDATSADALPLIAFLLRRLYDRHADDARLSRAEYDALGDPRHKLNPIEACIRDAADEAIRRFDPSGEERAALREAFVPGLVRIDERTGQHPRRPLPGDELPDASRRLIDALVDERLLIRRTDGSIEVAHEALFRVWPPLKEWLEQEQEFLLTLNRLDAAVADWQAATEDDRSKTLLTGLLLDRCDGWLATHPGRFSVEQRALIESSRDARDAARRRREKARVAVVAASLAVAVVLGVLALFANQQRTEAQDMAERAQQQERLALASAEEADQQRKLAEHREKAAEKATRDARWQAYVAAIRLAEERINAGQVGLARDILSGTPEEYRNWEYGHLLARSDGSLLVLLGHEHILDSASFNQDGTRVVTASADTTARVWDAGSGELIAVLHGHAEPVSSAAFSTDGTRVITTSDDHTARVWDACSGEQIAVLQGHAGRLITAAFSPDGTLVITTAWDQTARVWNAGSGEQLAVLQGHDGRVVTSAFTPTGTRVVTSTFLDGSARVWDAGSGVELAVLRGHRQWSLVKFASFSPDGARVITASSDNTARVWDACTGIELAVLDKHEESVWFAAFSPDGTRVVTASFDNTVRVWDAVSGEPIATVRSQEGGVRSVAFSPDGTQLVTAMGKSLFARDHTARIWDADSGEELFVLRGHQSRVYDAAFSTDGTRVITASADNTARVWDAHSGEPFTSLRGHGESVTSAAFSPDGTRVTTTSGDHTARMWDAGSGREITVFRGHELWVVSATFSRDGTRVATASEDHTARIWDVDSGRQLAVLRGHTASLRSAAFNPNGTRILTASRDHTARVWDGKSGDELAVFRWNETNIRSAVFSPDGSRVVTAAEDGTVQIWDAESGDELAVLRGHEQYVFAAAFCASGTRILSRSGDDTARVWDAASGKEIAVFRGQDGEAIYSAVFSQDGTRIVTAMENHTARVWDSDTGRQLAVLRGHESMVTSATFSPDGTRLITASTDGTARVRDSVSGEQLVVLRGHLKSVNSAVFSPDGTRLLTVSDDNTARVWDRVPASQRYRESLQHGSAPQPTSGDIAQPTSTP